MDGACRELSIDYPKIVIVPSLTNRKAAASFSCALCNVKAASQQAPCMVTPLKEAQYVARKKADIVLLCMVSVSAIHSSCFIYTVLLLIPMQFIPIQIKHIIAILALY